jgi:4-alpha-glucanotransferase
MKIHFSIHFHTVWGQTICIIGSLPELGAWNSSLAKEMQPAGEGNWELEVDLPDRPVSFEYRYFLRSNNQFLFEEWQRNHRQIITDIRQNYILMDFWQSRPQNTSSYSSAFFKSWFAHPCDKFERVIKSKKKLCIKVLASGIKRNQSLAVLGNQKELGDWKLDKALIMACDHFPEWSIELDASALSYPLEYKFCVIDNENKTLIEWENGDNRRLHIPPVKENETCIISGLQFRKEMQEWKCAGTVIPVFSLRSENSFGIGDFADMKKCIDWLKLTSQKILQVLPLNDTTQTHTWLDSYPYNAISIYALHPIYLNPNAMGELINPERKAFFKEKQKELNAYDIVDYEKTNTFKRLFFSELFTQEGNDILQTSEFQLFFEKNKEWLVPYAAYSHLRDKYNTGNFHEWNEHSRYNKEAIEKFCRPEQAHYKEIALYYYLQFHLHKQLSEVRDYAYAKEIVLKGDIPIGINPTGVEAWTEPELFNSRYQTGAPPDDFSTTGQNWGFPTYNWEEMEANHYEWWKKRFRKMADYFDAFRIDHILGFFRIWEIPEDSVQGLLGWFSPALPFSVEEIKNAGLKFQPERFTNAHINEQFLPELFGEYTQEITQVYLNRTSSRHFALKESFNTQVKIRTHFSGKDDLKSQVIREGLYAICNEVLFIRDQRLSLHFHPRISAYNSYIYRELDNADRYAFDYLYRDYFYQRHNEFWKEQGNKKLIPLTSSTDMLVCGEDLGMIPRCVPEVIGKLQILSLEIERMPKESNREFTDLQRLPYHSVCTTSTHDTPTLRMEWKENPEKSQRYYREALKQEGCAPEDATPDICRQIIFNHLDTRSLLVIIPLQDWLALDGNIRRENENEERINIPANLRHYWRYRMHLKIEDLLQSNGLNETIRRLIADTGR